MKAVSVRELKSNLSAALRDAHEAPVLVLKRRRPEALLLHVDDAALAEPSVRVALATSLYRDESMSLGRAAELSGLALTDFIEHVSQQGIDVVRGTDTVREDVEAMQAWLDG